MRWFLDRGCEAVKVCADPGDLILWDSRTIHYNCLPESEAVRSVLCTLRELNHSPKIDETHAPAHALCLMHMLTLTTLEVDMCYTPASYAKPDDLALKAQLFKDRRATVSPLTSHCVFRLRGHAC